MSKKLLMVGCPIYNKAAKQTFCCDVLVDESNLIYVIPNNGGFVSSLKPKDHQIVVKDFNLVGEYWELVNPKYNEFFNKLRESV